ncbi:acireductone dioxygenase [Arsukibacterium sp.]|uniref:1,2-dihydroxy-3-keto-5-methylthiopentene dioxygenase n=1 Tax=Arsukibacterium sp. TaxID=1977258 RepID=UPI00299F334F|nr:acireductone dioxygenase [Arsukibacterium sp.]MDX1539377.1 acireductone dioxygenase [Arsukibacterium sp.]
MSRLTIFNDTDPEQIVLDSTEVTVIQQQLQRVGVQFAQWQANAPVTADSSTEQIIAAYGDEIARLKAAEGYITVDVISLSPNHPDKQQLRQKFLAEHTHSEDEVRFFVRGQGLFCLHIGTKVYQVLCRQNDLISVPANTPHWFDMGSEPDFTAIRLFNNPDGWVAHFSGSDIATKFPLLA